MNTQKTTHDPFFNRSNCVDRLFKEYQKHKKLIIACDFDDTVYPYSNPDAQFPGILSLLHQCQDLGFHIVMFTASAPERFDFIRKWMTDRGIEIAAINKNPVEGLPFGHHGKIYFNILLDDRAGLWEAVCTLQAVINRITMPSHNLSTPA